MCMADPSWRPLAGGVAQRRRERRLRPWYRHEQQTVRMALARSRTTQLHGDRRRQGPGRRGTCSTTRHGDRSPLLTSRSSSASMKSPAGGRPAPLSEVAGWQERVQRHAVEHLADLAPLVQILDVFWIVRSPSRLSKSPRSRVHRVLPVCLFLCLRWRNSWWKCRPC